MRSGKLDQRVTSQTNVPTADTYGQEIASWSDTKTVWGEAITGGGKEFYAAQKVYAETKVVFRIRYDSSVVVTQRIEWLDRYFNILSIDLCGGQYRELLIATSEVV